MSSTKNGLPSDTEIRAVEVRKLKDKKIHKFVNVNKSTSATTAENYIESSMNCDGKAEMEQHQFSLDADHGEQISDVSSPDISLSSQRTLRYSDVENENKEHNISRESSDSIETLEDPPQKDSHIEINQSFLQQLSLTQNANGNKMDAANRLETKSKSKASSYLEDGAASEDNHDGIPEFSNALRPESLSLLRPLQITEHEKNTSKSESDNTQSSDSDDYLTQDIHEQGAHYIGPNDSLAQGLPQGTITRKGDMIQFVADNLTQKIKQSSPLSHVDAVSSESRRSSVRSIASVSSSTSFATSSGISRSLSSSFQQSPDDIPPIDPSAMMELENHARRVADSVDLMMGNIRNNLYKMSAITIGCQDAYKRSVDITCDAVDASIKSMYALMAKCEELSATMGPVEQLAGQIKEIKRILDLFESQLTDK